MISTKCMSRRKCRLKVHGLYEVCKLGSTSCEKCNELHELHELFQCHETYEFYESYELCDLLWKRVYTRFHYRVSVHQHLYGTYRWRYLPLEVLTVGGTNRWRYLPLEVLTVGGTYRWRYSPLEVLTVGDTYRWRYLSLEVLTVEGLRPIRLGFIGCSPRKLL